ncbi:hypothetical protein DdX_14863 [Ditylenchus destructor]|uniref:Uncharacterized protein n=1 Tax=Ditylenchus destructor TaxID=166010 RepID=A0AAD4MS14_9BILA|nr:hypothetical protein DdX_14863 [Ditylenchus destructor]
MSLEIKSLLIALLCATLCHAAQNAVQRPASVGRTGGGGEEELLSGVGDLLHSLSLDFDQHFSFYDPQLNQALNHFLENGLPASCRNFRDSIKRTMQTGSRQRAPSSKGTKSTSSLQYNPKVLKPTEDLIYDVSSSVCDQQRRLGGMITKGNFLPELNRFQKRLGQYTAKKIDYAGQKVRESGSKIGQVRHKSAISVASEERSRRD